MGDTMSDLLRRYDNCNLQFGDEVEINWTIAVRNGQLSPKSRRPFQFMHKVFAPCLMIRDADGYQDPVDANLVSKVKTA